jgi:hypothetical protein
MVKPTHEIRVRLAITPPATPDDPHTFDVVRADGWAIDGLAAMTSEELATALTWTLCDITTPNDD